MYSYDRRADSLNLNQNAFERMLSSIGDTARAIERKVESLGGIESAMRQGHGDTLKGQLYEMGTSLRTLTRRLGF